MTLYFKNVLDIGNLYLKEIIYEWEYEPIIFFCEDENNNEYYCHTIDNRFKTDWLIYRISRELKELLLTNKIDIRKGFKLNSNSLYYICTDGTRKKVTFNDVKEFLPDEDVYAIWEET